MAANEQEEKGTIAILSLPTTGQSEAQGKKNQKESLPASKAQGKKRQRRWRCWKDTHCFRRKEKKLANGPRRILKREKPVRPGDSEERVEEGHRMSFS